ncbi:hypothetical protein CDD83_4583 [Cordyceps sp. RAO-2017]|nr:hypothetical protein CDD83_4583 [Cordyceps sp. RAO-2017]
MIPPTPDNSSLTQDIGKRQVHRPLIPDRSRSFFAMEVRIGEPAQSVLVDVDTGSKYNWVLGLSGDPGPDARFYFNVSKSPTFQKGNNSVTWKYGSQRTKWAMTADEGRDLWSLGGKTLGYMRFGVSSGGPFPFNRGILGLSFPDPASKTDSLLDKLVVARMTQSRAYSIDIGPTSRNKGFITFGGVDTAKFTGPLQKIPVEDFGRPKPKQTDCALRNRHDTVDFRFGDFATIKVPFSDFIASYRGLKDCIFGAQLTDGAPILGRPFLRSAYVVFDQDNRNVHLAQSADCGSALTPITNGSDAVPAVSGRC